MEATTMKARSRGFVFSYRQPDRTEPVDVYCDAAGEWWSAPRDNAVDVRTGYRIGRWLGPDWWTEDHALRYLGLTGEEVSRG